MAPYLAKHDCLDHRVLRASRHLAERVRERRRQASARRMLPYSNEVAALLGDPFAGAHVGRLTELRDLGPWGQALLAAEGVADACVLAAANVSSIHQGTDMRFSVEGGTARIIFRFADRFEFDPRHFMFSSLAVLQKVPLLAGELSTIGVRLTGSRTRGSEALRSASGLTSKRDAITM